MAVFFLYARREKLKKEGGERCDIAPVVWRFELGGFLGLPYVPHPFPYVETFSFFRPQVATVLSRCPLEGASTTQGRVSFALPLWSALPNEENPACGGQGGLHGAGEKDMDAL